MNKQLVGKCLLTAIAVAGTGNVFAQNNSSNKKFAFAVLGDMPYIPVASGVQVYPAPEYERVIADINSHQGGDKVEFSVHVGDIKAGNTRCDDNVFTQNLTYFNSFKEPIIFTPGDNEWTDCHRANNGSYDPINRLQLIRTLYFPNNQSLGQKKRTLIKGAAPYVENSIWIEGPVLFVAIHQPGTNNNQGRPKEAFESTDPTTEYLARNAANMAFLDQAFAMANADNKIKGVAVFSQANPFERFLEPVSSSNPITFTVSGYADFIARMRTFAQTSGKRLIYFGGDTHYMRIDQPMTGTYPGCTAAPPAACVARPVPGSPTDRVNNFTRIEVFAQNDVHWIKVEVDSNDPGLFKFIPRRVPGNN